MGALEGFRRLVRVGANELRPAREVRQELVERGCEGVDGLWRADITNLNSDLTQPVKTLHALLDMPETRRIFGANLSFEMRGILVEKRGYSFRNDIAHGLVTQAGCYSEAAVNLWWLVLKLCHSNITLPDDLSEKVTG